MAEERRLPDFLAALGSGSSTPGGGAAAAVAGALAAALAEMVANFTVGRLKFAAVDASMRRAAERASDLRARLLALTEDDERAFAAVAAAYRLPKAPDDERAARDAAIQDALHAAMRPPLEVMRLGCEVMELAGEVASAGNPSVASDAGCAALLGEAAVRAAALNVLANVVLLADADLAQAGRQAVVLHEERAAALREHTLAAVHARMHI
jgi:glutamate formiminotransferase/formiminotetrahydrofolate cyclodeaminase